MDLKPIDLSEPVPVENVSLEVSTDHSVVVLTETDELKKENSELRKEIEELRKRDEVTVNKFTTTVIEHKPIDEEMVKKVKDLECQLLQAQFDLNQKTKEFEIEITARDTTNQNLLLKINELKEREPTLLGTIEIRTRERDSLMFRFEELKKEKDTIFFERENLLRSLQDTKVQLSELREAYSKVLPELSEARAMIASLEVETKGLNEVLIAKQEENMAILLRLAEIESARLELDNLRRLLEDTIRERDGLAYNMASKELEIADLRKELNKYAFDIQTKKDVIGHITQVEEVLVSDVSKLQEEIDKQNRIIEDLVYKQNELKTDELKYLEAIEMLKRDKATFLAEVEELRIENQRLKVENERVVSEKQEQMALVVIRDAQIVSLNEDFNRVAQDNRAFMEVIADLEKKRDAILLVLGEREAEIRRLKDSLEEMTSNLEFFKEKTRLLEEDIQKFKVLTKDLETENTVLKSQLLIIPDLESRIKELTLVNENLRAQLESFEAMKAEIIQLKSEIDGLIITRDNLLLSLQEKEGELSRLRPIAAEFDAVKSRAEFAELEVLRLAKLHETDELKIKELETMIVNLQFSIKNEKELADQNERLMKENTVLVQKVRELEYNYVTLTTKYQKLEGIYSQIKGVAEHIGDVHDKLIETVEETEKIDSALKSTEAQVLEKISQEKVTQEKKSVVDYEQTAQRF